MRFCNSCGSELKNDDKFCTSCGNVVSQPDRTKYFHNAKSINLTKVKGSRIKLKLILGALLAMVLVGSIWGWNNIGTESRAKSKLDLAVKYVSEKNYEKAILTYSEVIKIDPKQVKAYQGLGRVYLLQNQNEKAQQVYNQGLKSVTGTDVDKLNLNLASFYLDISDLTAAENVYQEIINKEPASINGYQGLAYLNQRKGDSKQAISMLQTAIEVNGQEHTLYNSLAQYYIGIGVYSQATEALLKSIALNPNQSEAYILLDSLYYTDWLGLQSELTKQTDPNMIAMVNFYCLYRKGDYQNALSVFNKELKTKSENQKAKILASDCFIKTGNTDQARIMIQEFSADQLNQWVMNDLANLYLKTGDKIKAAELARKSFEVDEGNIEAIKVLAKCDLSQNEINVYLARLVVGSWKPLRLLDQEIAMGGIDGIIPSSLIGNRINLSGISIGDSRSTVKSKLGQPKNINVDDVTEHSNKEKKVGDSMEYSFADIGVSKFSDRVIFVAYRNSETATNEGVRVGDPLSRVTDVYGVSYVESKKENDANFAYERIYTFSNGMLAFDYDSDVIKSIRMYRTPIQQQYIP